jgi:hypothetical protein
VALDKSKVVFPKDGNPIEKIVNKGWPVKLVLNPGSLLKQSELEAGHRKATSAVVQAWLKDIETGHFKISSLTPDSQQTSVLPNPNSSEESPVDRTGNRREKRKQVDNTDSGLSKSRRKLRNLAKGLTEKDCDAQPKTKKHQIDQESSEDSDDDHDSEDDQDSSEEDDDDQGSSEE